MPTKSEEGKKKHEAKGQKKSGLLTKLLQNLRKGAKMTKITKMVEAACQTIMKSTNWTCLTD